MRVGTLTLLGAIVLLTASVLFGIAFPYAPELIILLPFIITAYAVYRVAEWVWGRIRGTSAA